MNFKTFQVAVAEQYKKMEATGNLFRTSVEKDKLWETYLASFPEGSDPIYKTRTEHDCNCCKQFVRSVGDVVTLINGKMVSIWDCVVKNEPNYQAVANAMSKLVKSHEIESFFYHFEKTAGTARTLVQTLNNDVTGWDHFFVQVSPKFVKPIKDIPSINSTEVSRATVFLRALKEIDEETLDIVIDLIKSNSIYRGQEHLNTVTTFLKELKQFQKQPQDIQKLYAFVRSSDVFAGVAHINNSSIGTLLKDIASGEDLEVAVKKYESVVAGPNYKRPTALVSKKMVEQAKKTIEELGYTSALKRRFAVIEDVSVNNVLFADRNSKKAMSSGDAFDDLIGAIDSKKNVKNLDKVLEVTIEKFISDILPTASSLEVMMANDQTGNLVSLITAEDPTAKNMFQWGNPFSWSYNGEFADSIKERVKAAGGNVTGDVCCRLAWDYTDDLDFHMVEPKGHEIYFGNRRRTSPAGGMLDVDANGADGQRSDPVENIFYEKMGKMIEGEYHLYVNNYSRRSDGVGFQVEIDVQGKVYSFDYDRVVKTGEKVSVVKFKYSKINGIEMLSSLSSKTSSKEVWGIKTNTWTPVNLVMHSPNFWDGEGIGNKHYFFMLANCANEGQARGFYNEFFKSEITPHRKVMEMIGSRLKTEVAERQLSGLGFSSTQRNNLLCKVGGSFNRIVKINF